MAKKSFTEAIQQKKVVNPTLQFISQSEPEERPPEEPVKEKPAPRPRSSTQRRALPQYEETKSRRLQLLITPSLQEALRIRAEAEHTSVNELINRILSKELRKR